MTLQQLIERSSMKLDVLTSENSVGQWAACSPAAARTLADIGLDICCGGKRTLVDACREKNMNPADVEKKVMAAHAARQNDKEIDPAQMSIQALTEDIVGTHHAYLRQALPRIEFWIEKMVKAHGDKNPSFAELLEVFKDLHVEMQSHMNKEENVLFPMAAAMERGVRPAMNLMFPVTCMEQDHQEAGLALARIKELTNNFSPPSNACTTWRAAFSALAELDADMHRHVHKENNVLFPRILAMQIKN
jgi:regulator of cell morphogenesis and NO signaling